MFLECMHSTRGNNEAASGPQHLAALCSSNPNPLPEDDHIIMGLSLIIAMVLLWQPLHSTALSTATHTNILVVSTVTCGSPPARISSGCQLLAAASHGSHCKQPCCPLHVLHAFACRPQPAGSTLGLCPHGMMVRPLLATWGCTRSRRPRRAGTGGAAPRC